MTTSATTPSSAAGTTPSTAAGTTLTLDLAALGEFAATSTATDLPEQTWRFGRILLLDSLGALLGGLRYPAVRSLGASTGTAPQGSTPFGWLTTLGAAATWLDADSGGSFHPAGARIPPVPTAHPAPHVLPLLLHALLQDGTVDDTTAVHAFIVGCEVGLRFGAGTSLRVGLHPHGIHGPIAAAVAAGVLAGDSAETITRAIELAGSLPMGATLAVPMHGGTVRNVWTGLGSYYGALAAELARLGHPSDLDLLVRLYGGVVTTDADSEEIVGSLGERWRLRDSYLKPYACARWVHPTLDALRLALADAASPTPDEVRAIEVETFAFAASLDTSGDESDLHARFSVPRCAASVVVDGHLDADGFLPESFDRAEVIDLIGRIRLSEVAEFSAALPAERPARVTVRTARGVGVGEVRNARGNPDSPLTDAEVVAKFLGNVGPYLPDEVLDPVVATLTARETVDSRTAGGATLRHLAQALDARLVQD
ncbi:MmgE/PrpD family protein [Nocardioides sp. Iso805N]|uniref:MmgE/PrpD family protein n=1 Tax=Nocardioides sp. Iso805N TaxID=1283287 RepID=UPI00035C5A29|nr:MmgE/PrpD family protein [Nocardioides sp. Iso805N]